MYIVIFCSICAILLTFAESRGVIKNGMLFGFFLLTTLGVIHYDYGNDYMAYLGIYNDVTSYSFDLKEILDGAYFREPGWALLCWLFKPVGGFFSMVACLSIIQNIIVYKSITKYVTKQWWAFAVLLYACTTSLYLLSFSMLRQSFVIFIFLGLWPLIQKRKLVPALIIILLCTMVHKSSFILVPFVFLSFLPINNGKMISLSILFFFILLWISKSFLNDVLGVFASMDQFEDYAETYGDANEKVSFGLGYIVMQIPLILSIIYLYNDKKNTNRSERLLVLLSSVYYLIIPFQSIIPLISRIGFYFSVYQIISLPIIYKNIKHQLLRTGLLFINVFMTLVTYFSYFTSAIYGPHYGVFKTIFSEIL